MFCDKHALHINLTQKHSPKCSVGHILYFQKRGQNNYHILILFKWYTVRSGFGYITVVKVILRGI